jgi:uncharacterized surface protein with fasciclin (FAS1) repeats
MLNQKFQKRIVFAAFLSFFLISGVSAVDKNNPDPKKDIVATAVESGKFNILTKALTEAGLIETMKGEGPFTLFAPTDDAFEKLPEGTIESLLKDKEALKAILLYHVVSGKVTSEKVVELDKAETINGKVINIRVKDDSVVINKSKVITADVMASNGVIHIIDTVLIPE